MPDMDRESPQHIAQAIARVLSDTGIPITRICHFGSSVYLPDAKDIDILITVGTPERALKYDYQAELEAIRALMSGNFETPAPTDPYISEFAITIIDAIQSAIGSTTLKRGRGLQGTFFV